MVSCITSQALYIVRLLVIQVPLNKATGKLGVHHKTYGDLALQLCASYNRDAVHLLLGHSASTGMASILVAVQSTLEVAASTRESAKNQLQKRATKAKCFRKSWAFRYLEPFHISGSQTT